MGAHFNGVECLCINGSLRTSIDIEKVLMWGTFIDADYEKVFKCLHVESGFACFHASCKVCLRLDYLADFLSFRGISILSFLTVFRNVLLKNLLRILRYRKILFVSKKKSLDAQTVKDLSKKNLTFITIKLSLHKLRN